ncbi:MAG: helix-turn-helix domain-containing protein [Phycisphaerales bacterium]|jgi:y4mF family transcriptional regulator
MNALADIIKEHRKKARLTQGRLAQLAGVGRTVVWDIENGKESVQWDTLQKIFRVLNITVEWRSPLLQRTAAASPLVSSSSSSPSSSSSSPAFTETPTVAESKTPV